MLNNIDAGERSIDNYRGIVADEVLDKLRQTAKDLKGLRILHLNATPFGGGVAELLRSIVPLLNDLGLVAEWKTITGNQDFFQVTKTIHNALQGGKESLNKEAQDLYLKISQQNAAMLEEAYDIVFVHDPQPAPIPLLHGKGDSLWVWRCHIDTSNPNPDVWGWLRQWLTAYDAAIFTMAEFVPPDFPVQQLEIIPPAIDPLSPKNFQLADTTARQVLEWMGIKLKYPLITQVSRFDPWKDPMGVIEAYRLARKHVPNLQLALVGSMALDDPEGWDIYKTILAEGETDPLMYVFTNLTGVGNIEVNAFQSLSDVIVQKSIREGFGLVISEALWKETAVVAGRAGGIPLQMADGVGGYLVDSVPECADKIVKLLTDKELSFNLAKAGKERVRQNFLIPRLMLNELSLIKNLTAGKPLIRKSWESWRDHVCGMAVSEPASAPTAEFNGQTYVFCSKVCQARFQENPQHFT